MDQAKCSPKSAIQQHLCPSQESAFIRAFLVDALDVLDGQNGFVVLIFRVILTELFIPGHIIQNLIEVLLGVPLVVQDLVIKPQDPIPAGGGLVFRKHSSEMIQELQIIVLGRLNRRNRIGELLLNIKTLLVPFGVIGRLVDDLLHSLFFGFFLLVLLDQLFAGRFI